MKKKIRAYKINLSFDNYWIDYTKVYLKCPKS